VQYKPNIRERYELPYGSWIMQDQKCTSKSD
jgi:hypothetical protein